MDSAIMLAKVFGPSLAIIGLWMLVYTANVKKIFTAMKSSPPVLYHSAVLNLVLGLYFITTYNGWRMDIFFFVTLLGWVFFIKGLSGFFLPQVFLKYYVETVLKDKMSGAIPLVWGIILIWAGYYS